MARTAATRKPKKKEDDDGQNGGKDVYVLSTGGSVAFGSGSGCVRLAINFRFLFSALANILIFVNVLWTFCSTDDNS